MLGQRWLYLKFWLKRWWHWYFGKIPFKTQFGDWGYANDELSQEEMKKVFMPHVEMICRKWKAELVEKSLKFICKVPTGFDDPMNQRISIGWKADFILHTRKSWTPFLTKRILSAAKYKDIYSNIQGRA